MFLIDENKFDQFNKAMDKDSDIRFIFYLFDNYPILKRNFSFESLLRFLSFKNKNSENFYIEIEAEILFGEYYLEDPFFQEVIKDMENLSGVERKGLIQEMMSDFISNVVGIQQKNMIRIIDGLSSSKELLIKKIKFLNLSVSEISLIDSKEFVFGYKYKENKYIDFLEIKSGL